MEQLKVMIVEDEHASRRLLRNLLRGEAGVQIVGECSDGHQAVSCFRQGMPEILFLDVQMPGLDGFEVLRSVPEEQLPVTIFVTAYADYAVKAFEVRAFDYLLKPFDEDRFRSVMKRAMVQAHRMRTEPLDQRLSALLENAGVRNRPECDRIAVREAGRVVFVKTEKIDWIEAADNYVCLHCGTDVHTLRETMNALESRLDSSKFVRIHRSSIVNIDRIKELQPWFRGDQRVVLHDGQTLILSRTYRNKLRKLMFLDE